MSDTEDTVVVREATGDDLSGILAVGHATWPVTYGPIAGDDYVAMGLAKWWTPDATIPAIRSGRATVAEEDGRIVGVSIVGPLEEELVVWKLYVLPTHQGSGVGSRLMEAALSEATTDGWGSVVLSYLDGNELAAKFYRRFGFEFYERESAGSGMPDSIWVRRSLKETP